jgi:hypothetical protein
VPWRVKHADLEPISPPGYEFVDRSAQITTIAAADDKTANESTNSLDANGRLNHH